MPTQKTDVKPTFQGIILKIAVNVDKRAIQMLSNTVWLSAVKLENASLSPVKLDINYPTTPVWPVLMVNTGQTILARNAQRAPCLSITIPRVPHALLGIIPQEVPHSALRAAQTEFPQKDLVPA